MTNNIVLSKRLATLCQLISEKTIFADIGTDHGYLCVAYIQQRKGLKAYACDINKSALKQAENTVAKYQCPNVELQLMDGLSQLADDVKEIVIAGMGYDTIKTILENGKAMLPKLNKIIIQCNKNNDKLKKFITHIGLYINECHIVIENNIAYEILVVSSKNVKNKTLQDNENYIEYLDYHINKIKLIENYDKIPHLFQKVVQLEKKKVRQQLKAIHKNIDYNDIQTQSQLISKKIMALDVYKNAKCIALFASKASEFDTKYLLEDSLANKKIVFPKVTATTMAFYLYGEMKKNECGILEPINTTKIDANEIDVMIVPCLGYNALGYRIGYGKGYYDKYLLNTNIVTILPAIKQYEISFIPENTDIKMNLIIKSKEEV